MAQTTKPPRPLSIDLGSVSRLDYKDIRLLSRFTNSYGKIHPRKRTGLNAKQQRMVALAIKRARIAALLPFTSR